MSYDINCQSTHCDDLQVLERYTIDAFDFRTLHYAGAPATNMRAPINGKDLVRLYFRGSLVHPADPIYGYAVVPDPTRIQTGYAFSKIVFNKPIRALTPLVEVTYQTRPAFCLKCAGTGKLADWSVSPVGSLRHILGAKKLSQQAFKYVLTSVNPFNPTLTCAIRSYVGQKYGSSITDQGISSAVMAALSTYQSIQRAQKTVQTMDSDEMIQDVKFVTTKQDPADPTKLYVTIAVTTYGSTQSIPFTLALQTT